jgi:hypothetical protein
MKLTISEQDKKILYEKTMDKVICPIDFKQYSPDNVKWVKMQLYKGRVTDPKVRKAISEMLANIT